MRVLALDTTTRAGSVAIVDDERVLIERGGDPTRIARRAAAGRHYPTRSTLRITLACDIDLFAVAAGPGSFTGLRIGIATIQGLAFVNSRRVVPVSALGRSLAASRGNQRGDHWRLDGRASPRCVQRAIQNH